MKTFILLIISFHIVPLTFHWPSALAQTMSNDNYILQLQELDPARTKPTIKNSTLGVFDQEIHKPQPKPNYKAAPLIFSISETLIDFSTLSPTNPINRSNNLTVSSGSSNG